MFRKLCGDETLKNVVLVTNMWSEVSPEVGKDREKQLSGDFFKPVLDLGARMVSHHDTVESAHGIIRGILKNHPAALRIQKEVVDENKDIINTAAGEAVSEELDKQMKEHQAELKKVQEDMAQAIKDNDERAKRELEEDRKKLQAQMDRVKTESEALASDFAAEREKWETKLKEMEQKAREERERVAAEHKRQVDDLARQLRDATAASAANQARLEEIEKQRPRSIPIYK